MMGGAYGGSFLLKGSALCVERDLECGAAPRCCQHWCRLFAILFANLYNKYNIGSVIKAIMNEKPKI